MSKFPKSKRTEMAIFAIILLAFIFGSSYLVIKSRARSAEVIKMSSKVVIRIGESADEFSSRYGSVVERNRKNKGTDYISLNWPDPTSGTVVIENKYSSLTLSTVLMLSGFADSNYPSEGLYSFGISLGLPPRNRIMHEDARNKFFQLLGDIGRAGWKRWIEPRMPRMSGESAFRYKLAEERLMSLDPSYMPEMRDWMKLENRSRWKFYKDGEFLTVLMSRDSDRMDMTLPGAYFISIDLENQASQHRLYFQGQDRKSWQSLYPPLRKKLALERADTEAKLAKLGTYVIDVSYRNPDESGG